MFGICQSAWLHLQASRDDMRNDADLFVGIVIGSSLEPLIYTAA